MWMRNIFPSNKTNTTGDAQRQLGGGAVQAAPARQRNIYIYTMHLWYLHRGLFAPPRIRRMTSGSRWPCSAQKRGRWSRRSCDTPGPLQPGSFSVCFSCVELHWRISITHHCKRIIIKKKEITLCNNASVSLEWKLKLSRNEPLSAPALIFCLTGGTLSAHRRRHSKIQVPIFFKKVNGTHINALMMSLPYVLAHLSAFFFFFVFLLTTNFWALSPLRGSGGELRALASASRWAQVKVNTWRRRRQQLREPMEGERMRGLLGGPMWFPFCSALLLLKKNLNSMSGSLVAWNRLMSTTTERRFCHHDTVIYPPPPFFLNYKQGYGSRENANPLLDTYIIIICAMPSVFLSSARH